MSASPPKSLKTSTGPTYKYVADLEAKKADAASRRNAKKRQARAEAKKPKSE